MSNIDFESLNNYLLSNAQDMCNHWLPGGQVRGSEYVCGDLSGGKGDSLSVNLERGVWKDFAQGDGGSDLISLYAAVKGLKQGAAAGELMDIIGVDATKKPEKTVAKVEKPKFDIGAPPSGVKTPSLSHRKHGQPVASWIYRDNTGGALFYIARHNLKDNKKVYVPRSWDRLSKRWVTKHWPKNRPLYNLHYITRNPELPIILTEGEKAADAAQKIVKNKFVVTSWHGGSNGIKQTDWSPLKGRKVLLWPDNDEPGHKVMAEIGAMIEAEKVSVLYKPDSDRGADAADFVFEDLKAFHKFFSQYKIDFSVFYAMHSPNIKAVEKGKFVADDGDPGPEPPPPNLTALQINVGDDAIEAMTHKPSPSVMRNVKRIGLCMKAKGKPASNHDNVDRILAADYKGKIWYDEFYQDVFQTVFQDEPKSWAKQYDSLFTVILQRSYGLLEIKPAHVKDTVTAFAFSDVRNEPKEWLNNLKWDGENRNDLFFHNYFGAVNNEYTTAVSNNFMIGMVARVLRPGCKFDNMVVIEGKQGTLKSSALLALGGKWYVEQSQSASKGNKDFYQCLHSSFLIELPEMAAFEGVRSNTIKDMLSRRKDRYRAPYDSKPADWPRQSIFVGTTNDSEYLNDPTGARRYWPIKITDIDIEAIERDREQLFAEAVYKFNQGHKWYEVPFTLASLEQGSRFEEDPWTATVLTWCKHRPYVTVTEVATLAVGVAMDRLDLKVKRRIGSILRGAEYEAGQRRISGINNKVFLSPDFSHDEPSEGQGRELLTQPQKLKNYAPGMDDSSPEI